MSQTMSTRARNSCCECQTTSPWPVLRIGYPIIMRVRVIEGAQWIGKALVVKGSVGMDFDEVAATAARIDNVVDVRGAPAAYLLATDNPFVGLRDKHVWWPADQAW